MAIPSLPSDFKEFLKLLNSNGVEYLLVGGYAVGFHGHVRATNDLDLWLSRDPANAAKVTRAITDFGFPAASFDATILLSPNHIIRMGVPPIRIELLTSVSGVEFDACYAERESFQLEDLTIPVISLQRLRQNKAASARLKDLADLESLPVKAG